MRGKSVSEIEDLGDIPEGAIFHGFKAEQAEEFFDTQLHFVTCLCSLGMIWRQQWKMEPTAIPMEADIHG